MDPRYSGSNEKVAAATAAAAASRCSRRSSKSSIILIVLMVCLVYPNKNEKLLPLDPHNRSAVAILTWATVSHTLAKYFSYLCLAPCPR